MKNTSWAKLVALAEAEVNATLRSLPGPLREQARRLPVCYEPRPSQALLDDGWEPDLLGLFVGVPYAHEGQSPYPQQIFLFLENLWEETEGDEPFYREEVRITYLHELGHYLGLNETDLEERGLL
jgi:predicted Zn-dependent protease with MMP-like domain